MARPYSMLSSPALLDNSSTRGRLVQGWKETRVQRHFVEHLAIVTLLQPPNSNTNVIEHTIDLGAPGVQGLGGLLEVHHADVAFVLDGVDAEALQLGQALSELGVAVGVAGYEGGETALHGVDLRIRPGSLQVGDAAGEVVRVGAAGRLQGVDCGGAGGEAALQVGEPPVPVLMLVVEAAIQLRQLVEDEFEVGLHGTSGSLETGVVVVGIGVGVQDAENVEADTKLLAISQE
ncbi:uncharacterized protein [Miscanthus floridulus]|uniref:uncharacterized protein n=1 Tax=Miscanthus floridulus TaxID=154761 RepID=UPI00345B3AF7